MPRSVETGRMEAAAASAPKAILREETSPHPPSEPTTINGHPIDGVVRCACCRRFPLVGERVTRHVVRKGDGWACASCESAGRGERLGAVAEVDRVRSIGGANNVRRAA